MSLKILNRGLGAADHIWVLQNSGWEIIWIWRHTVCQQYWRCQHRQTKALLDKSIIVTNKTGWMWFWQQGRIFQQASTGEVSYFINKHGGFCDFFDCSLMIWENGY